MTKSATTEKTSTPDLTETQARRLAKSIQGESLAAIATTEGCSKQAVAKSLAAPAVRQTAFKILGRELMTQDKATGEMRDIVAEALSVVVHVMENATRPVVLTQSYGSGGGSQQHIERVPDYPTRLAAATRLLSLVDKPEAAVPPAVSIAEERETVTTHTRERRRVDAG